MEYTPLVIIHCMAYNHAPYIRQCLDGFVMQRTSFPFYAVVHDDASTDGTADIIRDYAVRYPNIIHPILEHENLWRKGDGSLLRNMDQACAGARYLAYCEGDDYWTDPLKLQKQVDFMEANLDYSVCYHPVSVLHEASGMMDSSDAISQGVPSTPSISLLAKRNFIPTASVLYRYNASVHQKLFLLGPTIVIDYPRNLLYADLGKIKRLSDQMAVYRLGVGVWSSRGDTDFANMLHLLVCLSQTIVLLQDNEAKGVLKHTISQLTCQLNDKYRATIQENERLRSTHAFRLGKFLLGPAQCIRNQIRQRNTE